MARLPNDDMRDNDANTYHAERAREKQLKTLYLMARIKKAIYARFDEHNIIGGLHFLNRFNWVMREAFPGERPWTPGETLDAWIEQRKFDSRC